MTTLLLASPAPANDLPPKSLGDSLRAMHTHRLGELRQALEPALGPEAGVWSRWNAARLVNDVLAGWFEPERQLIGGASLRVGAVPAARLWVAAELVLSLRWQMDHSLGLCHSPAEFSRITLKLQTVLEHWCREIEDALRRVRWQDLSRDDFHACTSLLGEESHHVT